MRNFNTKIDNDNTSAGVVVADEYNSMFGEAKNVVSPFMSLSEADSRQMVKSIDIASKAIFYTDTGVVNGIILERGATEQAIETLFDGMVVMFTPANSNTGATTLKIKELVAKPLKYNGVDLGSGFLSTNAKYIAIYDLATESFNCEVLTTGNDRNTVLNIGALRAFDKKINNLNFVNVLSHTSLGDGGGGIFYFDETEIENDDNGTIITPNSSPSQGRWKRIRGENTKASWFGALGNGVNNDATAIQNALNVNGSLELTKGKTYRLDSAITYSGQVTILGDGAVIKSDVISFVITDGANSIIKDIDFQPITTPYTVTRTEGSFTPTLGYSLNGYQPTVNDGDVWSGLTTEQQNQNIGGGIQFDASAVTQSNIKVSGILGNFVNIIMKDTEDSIVSDCIIKAGKNYAGGILFWCLDSSIGAGRRNKAINNIVKYASYSGIVYSNQYDGVITGNDCSVNGESGIKLWQGTLGDIDTKIARGMIVSNNKCYSNYYDGLDMQGTYGIYDPNADMRNIISNNISWFNRSTGIVINGKYNKVLGNILRTNGNTGIIANNSTDSVFENNTIYGNNTAENPTGYHQMGITGTGNLIQGNMVGHKGVANGYNYYISGDDTIWGMNEQFDGEVSVYLGSTVINRGTRGFLNITNNGFTEFDTSISDLNDVRTTSFRFSTGDTNRPDGNWYYVFTMGNGSIANQLAFNFASGAVQYRREYHDATWSAWTAF